MSSFMLRMTVQGMVLGAVSDIIGQLLAAYQDQRPLSINLLQLGRFVIFQLFVAPPNVYWQVWLENNFPACAPDNVQSTEKSQAKTKRTDDPAPSKQKLNVKNTAIKFALDQTFGAVMNCVLFLGIMGALNGKNLAAITADVKDKSVPILLAGQKFWPLVSIISFSVVPLEYRPLFGSICGMGWGVFLSLFMRG